MSGRQKRIQSAGALVGQAAAHGVLYGQHHRERVLYETLAEDELEPLGKLNEDE